MLNLLSELVYIGKAIYEGLFEAIKIDGIKVHLYENKLTASFCKMGHLTILASKREEAIEKVNQVKKLIKIIT